MLVLHVQARLEKLPSLQLKQERGIVMPPPFVPDRSTAAFSTFASWSCPLQGEAGGDENAFCIAPSHCRAPLCLTVLPRALPCSLLLGSGAQSKLTLNFTLQGWGSVGSAGELSFAGTLLPFSVGFASSAGCDPSPVCRPARALDSREPLLWRGVNR